MSQFPAQKIWILAASAVLCACSALSPTPPIQVMGTVTVPPPAASRTPKPVMLDALAQPWDDSSVFELSLLKTSASLAESLPAAPVYHMSVRLEDDLMSLEGKMEVRFTNSEGIELANLAFRLYPNLFGGKLEVLSASVDGVPVQPVLEASDSVLSLPLAKPLPPGAASVARLEFRVEITGSGNSNYNTFAYDQGVLALAQFYPLLAVYDEHGWHTEVPAPYGDVTYADAAFYLVNLDLPAGLKCASSGSVLGSRENDGRQLLTIAAGPIRDFYLAASADYRVLEKRSSQGVLIRSHTTGDAEEFSRYGLEVVERSLEVFSQRFGPYPYAEFDVVSTPTDALGVEYPGMTAISRRLFDPNTEIYPGTTARIVFESTLAHEVAHQWFYNLLGNDQVNEPWLDEAMAQYATYLYYLDNYGKDAADGYRTSWDDRWNRVGRAETPIGMPVSAYEPKAYAPVIYGRGPIFVEALAKQTGEKEFNAFLKAYYQTYAWGTPTTQGFRSLAEKSCGCDLGPLFKEWVDAR